MPNPNTNSTMVDNNRSTKKKKTDAKTAISKTVIVANKVSLLVAQVILLILVLPALQIVLDLF